MGYFLSYNLRRISIAPCRFVISTTSGAPPYSPSIVHGMVSRGVMYYGKTGKLRWEYTSPYTYTFLINGTNVMLKSSKKKDVIDIQSSRIFKEIARIMMNSVTGQCLSSKEDFAVTMFRSNDDKEWLAELVPQKKQMKQMFSLIRLHIDPKQNVVTKVDMTEKTGDSTSIQLMNTKINTPIDGKVFNLD